MSLILVLKCFWSWYWIFKKKSNEPDTGIEMFLVLVLDLQKRNSYEPDSGIEMF
jgi:hypothetical protein